MNIKPLLLITLSTMAIAQDYDGAIADLKAINAGYQQAQPAQSTSYQDVQQGVQQDIQSWNDAQTQIQVQELHDKPVLYIPKVRTGYTIMNNRDNLN